MPQCRRLNHHISMVDKDNKVMAEAFLKLLHLNKIPRDIILPTLNKARTSNLISDQLLIVVQSHPIPNNLPLLIILHNGTARLLSTWLLDSNHHKQQHLSNTHKETQLHAFPLILNQRL